MYYTPHLLQSDEKELAEEFLKQSATHDTIGTMINWGSAICFGPALYMASRYTFGWPLAVFTGAYVWLYYKEHSLNDHLLQSSLNKFALPYHEKYGQVDPKQNI